MFSCDYDVSYHVVQNRHVNIKNLSSSDTGQCKSIKLLSNSIYLSYTGLNREQRSVVAGFF